MIGGTTAGIASARDRVLSWLPVPVLSARTMGQFRVVFGLALFYVVLSDPPTAQPLDLHRNYSPLADWPWVHDIASSAAACRVLHLATLALAATFTVGLFTRPAFVALVLGILVSRLVQLQRSGTHDWDLPMLTLCVLTVVPWGDGFSLDRMLARGRSGDESRAGRVYGLAIWLPGFMMGLALAAAAYAKLANGGFAWITSGAVKYHFIEDAANAPVTWGLWIAAHPAVAVLMSLGAVLVEAAFIANAFVRSPWRRTAIGVLGLSLFVGFYLFQGVIWRPWLMLLLALLPWPLLDRSRAGQPATANLRPWHAVLLGALVVQQVFASLTATQVEPLISDYPMYSGTYESPEAFERARYRKLQRLVFESRGAEVTDRVRSIKNASENLLDAAEDVARGDRPQERIMGALRGVRGEYRTRFGDDLGTVTVYAERVLFDWDRGEFQPPRRVRIAEVSLPEVRGGS